MASGDNFEFKNAFFKSLITVSPPIIVHDLDGIIEYASPEIKNVLGYSPKEIIGKKCTDFLVKRDAKLYKERMEKLLNKKKLLSVEIIIVRKNKKKSIVELTASVFKPEDEKKIILTLKDVTEQKKFIKNIKKNRDKYEQIFDNVNDIILFTNQRGEIIEVNNKIYDLLGYKPKDLIGKKLLKLRKIIDWKSFEPLFKALSEAVIKKKYKKLEDFETIEVKLKNKKGKEIFVELKNKILREDGRIKGFLSVIRDVSKRKKFLQELKENQKKYKTLFENSKDPLILMDFKGKIHEVNKRYEKVFKIKKKEAVGKYFFSLDFKTNFKKKDLLKYLKDLINGKNIKPIQLEVKDKKKKLDLIIEADANVINLSNGKFLQVYARDITKMVRTHERIKESERMLSTIFNSTKDGIVLLDKKGKILRINKRIKEVSGYSKDAFLGKNLEMLKIFKPIDIIKLVKDFKTIIKKGKTIHRDYYLTLKGDEKKWFEIRGSPVVKNGKVEGVLANVRDINDSYEAQLELKASEEKFRKSIELAPYPIMIHSEEGKVISINKSWEKITGYKKEEISTIKKWTKKAYGKRKKVVKKVIDELYKAKNPVHEGEFTVKTKKGEERVWDFSSAPLGKNMKGKRLVLSIANDITKRKNAEEKYRVIFESSGTAMGSFGEDSVIINCNEEFAKLTGFKREEVIGKMHWYDFVTKEDLKKMKKYHKKRSKGKGNPPNEYECTIVNKKGEERIVNVNIKINPKTKLRIVSLIDITKRKNAEEALRESEERYRLFFETSSEGVILVNKKGRILDVNNKLLEIFDLKKDIIGSNALVIGGKFKIGLKKAWKAFKKALKGDLSPSEWEIENKKGKKINIIVHPSPMKKGEKIVGLSILIEDVTAKKKSQKELKKLEKKQELNEVRRNFLMLVTHELKQPLTPILGYADLLKEEIVDINHLKYIDKIVNSAEEMFELVNKIISLMRLETGQISFNFRKVSLKKLIHDSVSKKASLFNLKNIKVEQSVADVSFKGDYNLLRDVIVNLIDNAVKFSKPGSKISIKARKVKNKIEISVRDSGVGIKKEDIPKLFKTFSQTVEGSKKGGFGIGLSVSKMIIEKHKGKIKVDSTYGKGSTFTIILPKRLRV